MRMLPGMEESDAVRFHGTIQITIVFFRTLCMKEDRAGGRKDREVESERRRCGRNDGDTGKMMNTEV